MNDKIFKAEVKYSVDIPVENWIDFISHNNDIFRYNYCGYWLRGVEYDDDKGWLGWEHDDEARMGEEPDREHIIEMWMQGKSLPPRWFCLSKELAIKAYLIACQLWGEAWMDGDHNDSVGYDCIMQLALLGEEKYG